MTDRNISLDDALAMKEAGGATLATMSDTMIKVVVFRLDGEWFAFEGSKIKELLPSTAPFFLPGCPGSLEGVINVRGTIESVINLRAVLNRPQEAPGAASRLLLGHGKSMRSCIRVDSVEEVLDITQSTILPPPHNLSESLGSIVAGVFPFGEQLVTLLDLEHFFADYRAGLR